MLQAQLQSATQDTAKVTHLGPDRTADVFLLDEGAQQAVNKGGTSTPLSGLFTDMVRGVRCRWGPLAEDHQGGVGEDAAGQEGQPHPNIPRLLRQPVPPAHLQNVLAFFFPRAAAIR